MLLLLTLLACRKEPTDKPVDDTAPSPDSATADSADSSPALDTADSARDSAPVSDADGDGFSVEQGDCDDANPDLHPGAEEVCDGVDQDCDGRVDEGVLGTFYLDTDGDGFGDPGSATASCEGATEDATDCDDTRADVHPGADEVCDAADNDCDDAIDEEGVSMWYADADGDGYGDPDMGTLGCDPGLGVADNADCDDTDAAVSPAGVEVCNGIDDNCDGVNDEGVTSTWYIDYDGDGYGSDAYTRSGCTAPAGYVGTDDDCNDIDAAISPAATELCDEEDNNCDGVVDEPAAADAATWYVDTDGDGWGTTVSTEVACTQPAGFAPASTDCDDADVSVHPEADEACSTTVDYDCDGLVAEVCASCLEHLDVAGATTDGLYTIDPDGSAGAVAPFDIWCDMTTDGGGWTLVQRTVWDWTETSQLETGYADWYAATLGDPNPGFAWRAPGEVWAALAAEEEMMTAQVPRDEASGGDCGTLYYQGSNVSFTTTSATTEVSSIYSSVYLVNATELSTTDSGPDQACVNRYGAVPWFYSGCCTTCPSFAGSYWSDAPHPMASYIDSTADIHGQRSADVCPSGAAISSYGYEGVNSMEIYLR